MIHSIDKKNQKRKLNKENVNTNSNKRIQYDKNQIVLSNQEESENTSLNSTGAGNILIYDRFTLVGSIYFIGCNTNFLRGKVFMKKSNMSDKIVRQTNLNEHIAIIQKGNFKIKHVAFLIKGLAAFLYRQFEVLMNDFQILYKKVLYNNVSETYNLKKCVRKGRKHKILKPRKKILLSLKDIHERSNGCLMNASMCLNKNKNIGNINDLTLKEANESYEQEFHLEQEPVHNSEHSEYNDMFVSFSSLQYSKMNNFYSINEKLNQQTGDQQYITDQTNSHDIPPHMQSSSNDTLKLKLIEIRKLALLKNSGDVLRSSNDILGNPNVSRNNEPFRNMNDTLFQKALNGKNLNMSLNHWFHQKEGDLTKKTFQNEKETNLNKQQRKRNMVEIDESIVLNEDVWDKLRANKKKKTFLYIYQQSEQTDLLSHFFKNPKQVSPDKSFNTFYEATKNYKMLDSRKELHNLIAHLIQTSQENIQEYNNRGMKRKYPTTMETNKNYIPNSSDKTNPLQFEKVREFYQEDHQFMNETTFLKRRKFEKYSNSSISFNNSYEQNLDYNFDSFINFPNTHKNAIGAEKNEQDKEFHEHSLFLQNPSSNSNNNNNHNKTNSTFTDSFKETISVPSSRLMNKRTTTAESRIYDEQALKLKNQITNLKDNYAKSFPFEHICPTNQINKRNAALMFYNLLVLASNDEVQLIQNLPNKSILIQTC